MKVRDTGKAFRSLSRQSRSRCGYLLLIAAFCLSHAAAADDSRQGCERLFRIDSENKSSVVQEAFDTGEFIRKSGVDSNDPQALISHEAITHRLISDYVMARESFRTASRDNYADFNQVRVFSSPEIFIQYQHQIILSNPLSPGTRLGKGGERNIRINNIAFLSKMDVFGTEAHAYAIKLHVEEKAPSGRTSYDKTITMAIKYTELELSPQDKCLNPVGFRVFSYDNGGSETKP